MLSQDFHSANPTGWAEFVGIGLDHGKENDDAVKYTFPHDHRAELRCYSQQILFIFHGSIYLANIMLRRGEISNFWLAKLRLTILSTLKDNAERCNSCRM